MKITKESHPALAFAFEEIERDNGGHLIGTVYPGEAPDLEAFVIPDVWAPLVPAAEAALAALREPENDRTFIDFVVGPQHEQDAIYLERGNLDEAKQLLNAFFNDWQEPLV